MSMFNNSYNTSSSQFGGTQMGGQSEGGGGFLNTQENDFGSSNNAQIKKVIPMAERTLTPLTLKQLATANPPESDENLMIGNVEIYQIQLIGEIKQIDIQASHTTLTINDGTANMNIKQWSGADADDASMQSLSEGIYIKVTGRPNVYNNNISVNAHNIRPITNYDEITYHFIECVYAQKKSKEIFEKNRMNNDNNMSFNNNNTSTNYSANNGATNNPGSQWNNNNNNNNNNNMNANNSNNNGEFGNETFNADDSELTDLQRRIMQIIKGYDSVDEGVDCETIFSKMPGRNMGEIRQAIEELTTQGSVYTTVDEEHFKASV